jgi:hypothetical protein
LPASPAHAPDAMRMLLPHASLQIVQRLQAALRGSEPVQSTSPQRNRHSHKRVAPRSTIRTSQSSDHTGDRGQDHCGQSSTSHQAYRDGTYGASPSPHLHRNHRLAVVGPSCTRVRIATHQRHVMHVAGIGPSHCYMRHSDDSLSPGASSTAAPGIRTWGSHAAPASRMPRQVARPGGHSSSLGYMPNDRSVSSALSRDRNVPHGPVRTRSAPAKRCAPLPRVALLSQSPKSQGGHGAWQRGRHLHDTGGTSDSLKSAVRDPPMQSSPARLASMYARQVAWKQRIDKQYQRTRDEAAKAEVKECSFMPRVSRKSRILSAVSLTDCPSDVTAQQCICSLLPHWWPSCGSQLQAASWQRAWRFVAIAPLYSACNMLGFVQIHTATARPVTRHQQFMAAISMYDCLIAA